MRMSFALPVVRKLMTKPSPLIKIHVEARANRTTAVIDSPTFRVWPLSQHALNGLSRVICAPSRAGATERET